MRRRKLDLKKAYKSIGLNIRSIRESKGYTLEHMEELTGITWQHFQKIESGRNTTVKSLVTIAHAFGIAPSVLFKDI